MKINRKAFTLIELMVVITIMGILSMMVYAPYQHYQTKQKVRNSAKIVTQTLQQARNLAINWISTGTWNTSIGVLFESGAIDITLFAYPYDKFSIISATDLIDKTSWYIYEGKKLEPWVQITWVKWANLETKVLFIYTAISGSWSYYYYNPIKTAFTETKPEIHIWFKGVNTGNLAKKIDYYTRTYVADVQ